MVEVSMKVYPLIGFYVYGITIASLIYLHTFDTSAHHCCHDEEGYLMIKDLVKPFLIIEREWVSPNGMGNLSEVYGLV